MGGMRAHQEESHCREAQVLAHLAAHRETRMHDDRSPFRAPAREPKPGTFHGPAHGFGMRRVDEAAKLKLSGPMSGEQKLGEGLRELPLVGSAPRTRDKA